MIAHRFRFVKNFFQVFSNFFVLSSAGSRRHHSSSLADDLIRIPQAPAFVKHFFQVFQTSFRAQPGCSLVVSALFRKVFSPREALASISKHFSLYQHLFSVFSSFFSFLRAPLIWPHFGKTLHNTPVLCYSVYNLCLLYM